MERILLVQTAFAYHQVFVIVDGKVEKSFLNEQNRETLQFLMRVLPEVSDLEISGIVFVQGPGSFTSLRIGATWVNTLAYAKKLPIYNVTTLQYLALLLGKKANEVMFTFDDKRFFLADGDSVVESSLLSEKELLHPDAKVLNMTESLLTDIGTVLRTSVPMTDVLYVVPPKITLRNS